MAWRKWVVRLLGAMVATAAVSAPTREASAFCGFYVAPGDKPLYNDASMVALMREGTRTVMSMSNNYKGPASDFAMVVPVPVVLQKENVKTLSKAVFTRLETLSAPRLVEYWEQDPCNPYPPPSVMSAPPGAMMKGAGAADEKSKKDYGVKIEAKFEVGEYQILILSAKESDGLERWLVDNKYNIPKGASAALAPYIKEQQKFFVAKIDMKKVQVDAQGVAVLSPLRFSYESADFRLPVRLGLLNAKQKQDLIVFTLSKDKRFEVANYPNVYIPTNLEVSDDTRSSFAPFYAALFDEAVSRGQGKGIVTEYAWSTPFMSPYGGAKCDPCPPAPLTTDSDLAMLGGDLLYGIGAQPPPSPPGGPGMGKPSPMMWGGGGMNVVLTRLHARYDQTSLTDDLIFKGADPIVGGREFVTKDGGEVEKGAQPATTNNFPARYIIRHHWTGPIKCANPKRNVWGGPTGATPPAPVSATNLASAARGTLKFATYLKKGMPEFDVKVAGIVAIAPPAGGGDMDAGSGDATVAPEGSDASSGDAAASASTVPSVEPGARGCGCDLSPSGSIDLAAGLAAALAGLGMVVRRRKK
jgi:hypothetical protein